MIRRLLASLLLLITCVPASMAVADDSKSLKVLFLGDKGHHKPADRAAQIIPVLAGRGIEVVYTEDMTALNAENLAKFDALAVYANIDTIADDQAKALLDYVENGGGFVPLHCASYCFRNNPSVVALIGAQFKSHGTGEFDTKVIDAAHPIMKGLDAFRTWDETYVHTLHNTKDRTVLAVRADASGEEPWTWVRTQGKGRVFYTAYGHDERTWTQPAFQDLVERGIRWAASKEVFDSHPRVATGLKPFDYQEAEVPNYLPAAKWGTMGEPIKKMQKPLEPAESAKHLVMPAGFEAKLFASEPDIAKPIAMAWDHKGRLWIAETVDYPNNKRAPGEGHDQIKVCEDTDGDGKADKFTVFADNLSIPTSLTFADGGLIVSQAPELLFLKDTDGDGKADVRKILFTGWGVSDTHAGPSNLRYGFDNYIWGIVGYAGFNGEVGGEHAQFRQGIYRFKPDGSKLEFLRSTSNNSWGLGFSEEGLIFGSTANGCASVHLAVPNRYYEKVRGASSSVLANIADSNRFYPATEKVRQVDFHGGFTAAAGHALYTARAYPREYWNSTAFVTEPTGHIVATFTLQPRGTEFAAHYGWNLLASDDEWTSPVAAEVGPDGNVWVIDWYNFIVQHNPTPQGWKTGKGAAYETPLRDKTHGRIYRIVHKDSKPLKPISLDPADPKSLFDGLKSDNMLWRMHAQRLIVERGNQDVIPALAAIVNDPALDGIGLNPAAIHALHAMEGLKAIADPKDEGTKAAIAALKSPSAGVRRNALEVVPRTEASLAAIEAAGSLIDADLQVRLAAFLAVAEMPSKLSAGGSIARAILAGSAENDKWLIDAATAAASTHDLGFLTAIAGASSPRNPGTAVIAISNKVAEHLARGASPEAVAPLIASLAESKSTPLADAIVIGLAKGWPKGKEVALDDKTEAAIGVVLAKVSAAARGPLVGLATRWGSKSLEKNAAEIAATMMAEVKDESKPEDARIDAARRLVDFRRSDPEVARSLLELVSLKTAPKLAVGLVEAVGSGDSPSVGAAIVDRLGSMTPTVRDAAIRALLGRQDWTTALIEGVEQDRISLSQLALDQRQALAAHPDKGIADKARKLLASGGGLPDADRQKVIEEFAPKVLKGGDATRGKLVFEQQCAKCHMHEGKGGKVGPDLSGMAAHPREELLIAILDPSRSVEGNFIQYSVATNDGRVFNGLLASETKTSVELLDAEGKPHSVPRSEIEEIIASKKSLMPEGFEKQVPSESFADLLAFLSKKGKYLPLDLRKAATISSAKGMFYEDDGSLERLVFDDWSPKTFNGIPYALVDPQAGRVPNVVMLNGPNGVKAPKMPKSVTLPCHTSAKAIHVLGGISGWGYLGGEPSKAASMIVRLRYADGSTEDHPLLDGVHMADYIRRVEVPGSTFAHRFAGGQQIRTIAIKPDKAGEIESIELLKGKDSTAPVVMGITVEVGD